jgi:hypothetical protein
MIGDCPALAADVPMKFPYTDIRCSGQRTWWIC